MDRCWWKMVSWKLVWFACEQIKVSHFSFVFKVWGNFAFCLRFKASSSAKPSTWKLVLFSCKLTKMCMWIKLIFILKVCTWPCFETGKRQLGNYLLTEVTWAICPENACKIYPSIHWRHVITYTHFAEAHCPGQVCWNTCSYHLPFLQLGECVGSWVQMVRPHQLSQGKLV